MRIWGADQCLQAKKSEKEEETDGLKPDSGCTAVSQVIELRSG